MPKSAWATHSVMTSASVILRLAFLARLGRRSSAVTNTAMSSRSRSASIVAPLVDGNIDHRRLRPALHTPLPRPHGRGINHLGRALVEELAAGLGPADRVLLTGRDQDRVRAAAAAVA